VTIVQYTVVLEIRPSGGYRGIVPALPGCVGEGLTREEALARVKAALEERLTQVEFARLEVSTPPRSIEGNPWLETAGWFADDEDLEDMMCDIYAARDAEKESDE
jgi:predicted RNase H-like HicB family nuclease